MLLTSAATAAGLGKLTVLSALGQPLRAEIELMSVSADEAAGLVAKLASQEAYRAANIEFNPALQSLRFAVEQRGGRQYVRITSPQPMNEPFVDLLLELSWNNGRLVREYTFLLDPAELRTTQSAQVAPVPVTVASARARGMAAAPASSPTPAPAAQGADRPQRGARAAETAGEAAPASRAGSKYRVRSGDTLSRIAGRIKPVDVSLDLMLVALYRANPDAFIGNNMNRLKSGQILSVPSADSMRGLDAGDAHGTVVAHAADFNAYRAKLAGQVATSTPAREAQAGQSATGRITAKVEERPTAANESADQLRLSKALPPKAAGGAAPEDLVAREKELADAQQRVKELEKNVSELEGLITVKSQAAAAATQPPAAATPAQAPARAPADTQPAPAPRIKPAPPATPVVPAETSFADGMMDNITILGAGAAVLLLAALGLSRRRKKPAAPKPAPAVPTILGSAAQPAQSMFAETGGQNVDTHDSVFNSSFAPSASQLDTNEVDPLAEAELYLAYNFDTQAEDILKEALRNDPQRHPVRLKLLEIYANRKDVRAFETQATELYSLTGGKGDEWAQAAMLGHTLDPANPMYAQAAGAGVGSGAVGAGVATGAAAGAATGVATAALTHDAGPQTMLSQQLEQAFRSRGEPPEIIEPASTVDAVTGTPAGSDFDLDSLGLGSEATALPRLHDSAPAGAAQEDNSLDFDLGGLSFEPVSATEPTFDTRADETAVPDLQFDMAPFAPLGAASGTPLASGPATSNTLDDLAFDMNFGSPDSASALGAASAPIAPIDEDDAFVLDLSKNGPNTDIDMAQLAREFELPDAPDAPAIGPVPQPATQPADDLKDPLFDLDAMDFDLADTTAGATAAERQEPVFDFNSTDFDSTGLDLTAPMAAQAGTDKDPLFDLDMMDFGQSVRPATPTPGTPAPQFDMSGLNLDLPAHEFDLTAQPAPALANVPAADVMDDVMDKLDSGGTAELTAAQMEMETKLDLAIAYQEIGDKEGARELLDEVIKGGNVEQSSRASAMRAQLA
ncbi:MAG: FimV/HubP family polar landmark protein [Telluria sp.]